MKILLLILFFFSQQSIANNVICANKDQSLNMCRGRGFCSTFPLGEKDGSCGDRFILKKPWKSYDMDCISNEKEEGIMSCQNKGVVKRLFCGKEICYICECR